MENKDIKVEIWTYVAFSIGALILILAFFYTLYNGMLVSEKLECMELQELSNTHTGFYLTEWQAEMCEYHNVEINAPIK